MVQGARFRYESLRRRGFEPHLLHFNQSIVRKIESVKERKKRSQNKRYKKTMWPSGLRRVTRNHFSYGGVGSNPAIVVFNRKKRGERENKGAIKV